MTRLKVLLSTVSDGLDPKGVPAGAWISCTNGHKVCFCEDGIAPGELFWPQKLSDWQQRQRQPGEPFLKAFKCDECEAYWDIVLPEAVAFHASKAPKAP